MSNLEAPNTPTGEDTAQEGNNKLGAKILAQVGFDNRHKSIVESSFNKSIKRGEKLPGKNTERRNLSYLSRLERLIGKYGNPMEKKLWQASIKDDLLIKEENVTEATWEAKRQEMRDEGYGSLELSDERKHEYCDKWRELQRESLEKWANYLGDEHSPYPLWFKVYAWDGMLKMGAYSKEKGKYENRNETTVAPYPDADPEILAGVFDVVNRYFGNNEKEFYTEDGERNIQLEKIAQSGNFAKIYNAIQQDIAPIVEPPENPEDVHGEWREYVLGEEDDVARAAKGTGWCVATPSVGRHYLEYGTYGQDDHYYDEYEDENHSTNEAKFIIFHLIDPKTGKLSKNGCASIRLDPDGKVAEISGLKEGQALNDSLVEIVEARVKILPGGEEFLPKFHDKKELIRLDRKMQNHEDLTKEELEFIYEINRPITTLDTYSTYDPRIEELKEAYGLEYALDHGISPDILVSNMYPDGIAANLDTLINHGANIDIGVLVSNMYPDGIARNLDTLINHGANIDTLVSNMEPYDIARNLDTFIDHGANIDIDALVSKLRPHVIAENLNTLINHGANIDTLVSDMDLDGIARNLDTLINHGANIDIDALVSKLRPHVIAENLDTLINHGANIDIDTLVSKLTPYYIAENLNTLINHGANIDTLVSKLRPNVIAENLNTLINHGANIDIDTLVSNMHPHVIAENLNTLINHGANIDTLVSNMDPYEIARNLDTLINHGANIDIGVLVSNMGPYDIAENLGTLRRHGANV